MLYIASIIFFILDPFGNVVVLNELLRNFSAAERRRILLREAAIATAILFATALMGDAMLELLGLHLYSIRLAGGILLFLIAIGMVHPAYRILNEAPSEAPLIV